MSKPFSSSSLLFHSWHNYFPHLLCVPNTTPLNVFNWRTLSSVEDIWLIGWFCWLCSQCLTQTVYSHTALAMSFLCSLTAVVLRVNTPASTSHPTHPLEPDGRVTMAHSPHCLFKATEKNTSTAHQHQSTISKREGDQWTSVNFVFNQTTKENNQLLFCVCWLSSTNWLT